MLAEQGDTLPPIMVHKPTMRVIDGVHRVQAAVLNGQDTIEARLLSCDANEAFILAVRANVSHGLPLSQPDRMAAAVRIINANPHWSDRAVAAAAGLSDKTVSRIRDRSDCEAERPNARLGKDGRLRPLDSGAKRQRAAMLMKDNPDVGLRSVARATGLSPSTVHDVRRRVLQGEDPVPARYRTETEQGSPGPPVAYPPCTSTASHPQCAGGSVDQRVLLAKLRRDPSLRFNDSGRHILRWLHRHTVDAEGAEKLCRDLPDHWVPVIADLAWNYAAMWTSLAETLHGRIDR
ncbi:ParB/RepB/Spo0J family partition protein [Streptomyces collinus]